MSNSFVLPFEDAKRQWNSPTSAKVIIVTTDINIRELNITNPDLLIHFDVPTDALRVFAIRYSPLWTSSGRKNVKVSTHFELGFLIAFLASLIDQGVQETYP